MIRIHPSILASRSALVGLHALLVCLLLGLPSPLRAEPADFHLPAQSAADALLAFSKQAKIEVLYSFDQLRKVPANAVIGRFEPAVALNRLLKDTGFAPGATTAASSSSPPSRRPAAPFGAACSTPTARPPAASVSHSSALA